MKIGLKIWSINYESFAQLVEFHDKGIIDYVEMYIVPDSDCKAAEILKNIPLIFHAPNYHHLFSITNKDEVYEKSITTIRKFVDFFGEKRIIFHPGYGGTEDLVSQIKDIGFDVILENVPAVGLDGELKLNVPHYSDFKKIIHETGVKFCLDFGHAFASAHHFKLDPIEFVEELMKLKPYLFHVCDSMTESEVDQHLNLSEGDMPLHKLIGMIPDDAHVSLETPKRDFVNLSEDEKNLKILNSYTD